MSSGLDLAIEAYGNLVASENSKPFQYNAIEELAGKEFGLDYVLKVCEFLAAAEALERQDQSWEVWSGTWQSEMVTNLLCHLNDIWQGPRQETGKSYTAARVAAAFIACGLRVIIAMPTLTQGSRIMFRQISRNLTRLERVTTLSRVTNNTTELLFNNGGQLLALSSDEGAEKEGYTCELLIVDESHKSTRKLLGVFEPFLSRARKKGIGFALLLGIGGHRNSLIEQQKQYGYHSTRITMDRMVGERPELQALFDGYRETLTAADFRVNYEVLPALQGNHLSFPEIQESCSPIHVFGSPRRCQGVDVGRLSDKTVLTSLLRQGRSLTLDYVLEVDPIDFPQQALILKEAITKLNHVQYANGAITDSWMEVNGIGKGLHDIMQYGCPPALPPILRGFTPVPITYDLKEFLYDEVGRMMRSGRLVVPDQAQRDELSSLGYEIRWSEREGSYKVWDHSDLAASLIMACCGVMGVGGSM